MNNFVPNFNFGGYNQPYNMYPFNNNYNAFQQMQQNQQMQQTQTQQQPTSPTNTNKIFVNGIEDVKNRQLPFNSDFVFLDNDKPVIYQKTVDSKGQFEVKAFDIVPKSTQNDTKEKEQVDLSNYVLRSDFDKLQGQIKGLEDKLSKMSITKQIESIKRNEDINTLK